MNCPITNFFLTLSLLFKHQNDTTLENFTSCTKRVCWVILCKLTNTFILSILLSSNLGVPRTSKLILYHLFFVNVVNKKHFG